MRLKTKNYKLKMNSGFTMAELILVFGILAILTAIAVPNYGKQRNRLEFNNAMTEVMDVIRTARNYAVTSRAYFDGVTSVVPKEGYGVYIQQNPAVNESHFSLFANIGSDPDRFDATDVIETNYQLPGLIDFTGLNSGDDNAVIIFKPPLADAIVATNDPLDLLSNLEMSFANIDLPEGFTPATIRFNPVAGFPEYIPPQPPPETP